MSAFMVEDKLINGIVCFLVREQEGNKYNAVNLYGIPIEIGPKEQNAEFAQSLFNMNVDSIHALYGDDSAKDFRDLDFKYRWVVPPSKIQAYKALNCLLYQSCEGEVDETPLFKMMRKIESRIASSIVHDLPEYDAGHWG